MIPYGKQSIDESDIDAVVDVLRSDFLTTGPVIKEFEQAVAEFTGASFAIALSNGTAALHAAVNAAGVSPGDEVVTTPMTFASSANCVLFEGAHPVFADICPDTLLIDPESVRSKITEKTRAIIAVDYAGQPCDYPALRKIADEFNLTLIADACHSIGGALNGESVGNLADMTCLSFHPVKHITTGEGGMILTNNENYAAAMRTFRNHGITTDFRQREENGSWFYEMVDLGFNYRISDIQCALGKSQLKKLGSWIERRQQIAAQYDRLFEECAEISPLVNKEGVSNAYHLYVVKLAHNVDRAKVFKKMRDADIGVNVHYIPVHLHPYYQNVIGTHAGLCPVSESVYEHIISLPMYPGLTSDDQQIVIDTLLDAVNDGV